MYYFSDILDGVILNAENDMEIAKDFIRNMKREFSDMKLCMMTFDELHIGMSMFESAAKLFDTSRFLLVLVTKNFMNAGLQRFLNEVFLINVISFTEKNSRLILVIVDRNCYLPELAPLIPLQYCRYLDAKTANKSDTSFIRTFQRLVESGREKYLTS